MRRLKIVNYLIAAGFIFLCFALIYLQLIQSTKYRQLSQANRIRISPELASRGNILDRNGEILAGSVLSYDLCLASEEGSYPKKQIAKIASLLSISEKELNRFRDRFSFTTKHKR